MLQVQIPTNAKPGDTISQQMNNGTAVVFTVPPGAGPGAIIQIPIQNQTVSQNNNNNLNSLNENNKLDFCNTFTCTRVMMAFCLAFCLGIVATIVHILFVATGNILIFLVVVIIGACAPPILWMVWYSEGIGGHSIDRCQIAIVFFTNFGLMIIWLILAQTILPLMFQSISKSGNIVVPYHANEDPCCFPYLEKGSIKNGTNMTQISFIDDFAMNKTTKQLIVDANKHKSICVCPISAIDMIMWSALPEEILKYLSIAFFSYRSYIADPESMMSISLASGAGFALVENILYIVVGSSNIMISLIRIILPFPLHVLCQMINGVHLAKRKFVYRETGLKCDCKCTGKLPWWYIIAYPFAIHAIHNGFATLIGKSTGGGMLLLLLFIIFANLIIGYSYLRYKYIALSTIPRVDVKKLQILGWLPTAFCCRLPCWEKTERTIERRLTSIYELNRQAQNIDSTIQQPPLPPLATQQQQQQPKAVVGVEVQMPQRNPRDLNAPL